MTDVKAFVDTFLSHEYDPVKAHEYYMRVRQLKGRAGVARDSRAKEYETHVVGDAQKRLNSDIKKGPKVKPTRRIDAAERKLIRARALVMRIKDPTVKADMMAKLVASERKLKALQRKHGVAVRPTPKKATTRVNPKSKLTYDGKPLPKLGTRMNEDETPAVSPTGAKLIDYDGKGLGKGTYADGNVYDAKTGWSNKGPSAAKAAKAKNDAEKKANRLRSRAPKPVLRRQE